MTPEYRERFLRLIGITDEAGLHRIRSTRIAIGGLGLGGSVFINLVRMGFVDFRVADPDTYERTNIGRQRLAKETTVGRHKDECLIAEAREINPEITVQVHFPRVKRGNVDRFLAGAGWAVDAVDVFAMPDKLALHEAAHGKGIPIISCASLGFSGVAVAFEKGGPSFAELSGVALSNSKEENFRHFARFLAPEIPAYMLEQVVKILHRIHSYPVCGARRGDLRRLAGPPHL